MKKQLMLVCALSLVLVACERDKHRDNKDNPPKADNTERNIRDRDMSTMTSGDQGESELDRTLSQKIRSALVGSDTLSTNAKNIKIITKDGVVTLRGTVETQAEKNAIDTTARSSGAKRIDNQLEVKAGS